MSISRSARTSPMASEPGESRWMRPAGVGVEAEHVDPSGLPPIWPPARDRQGGGGGGAGDDVEALVATVEHAAEGVDEDRALGRVAGEDAGDDRVATAARRVGCSLVAHGAQVDGADVDLDAPRLRRLPIPASAGPTPAGTRRGWWRGCRRRGQHHAGAGDQADRARAGHAAVDEHEGRRGQRDGVARGDVGDVEEFAYRPVQVRTFAEARRAGGDSPSSRETATSRDWWTSRWRRCARTARRCARAG